MQYHIKKLEVKLSEHTAFEQVLSDISVDQFPIPNVKA